MSDDFKKGEFFLEGDMLCFGYDYDAQVAGCNVALEVCEKMGMHPMDVAAFMLRVGYYLALRVTSQSVVLKGVGPTYIVDKIAEAERERALNFYAEELGKSLAEATPQTETNRPEDATVTPSKDDLDWN